MGCDEEEEGVDFLPSVSFALGDGTGGLEDIKHCEYLVLHRENVVASEPSSARSRHPKSARLFLSLFPHLTFRANMSPPSDPTVKGLGALTETFDGCDLRVLIVHARLVTPLALHTALGDADPAPPDGTSPSLLPS